MVGQDQQAFLSGYKREYYGGALMILIGLGTAIQGQSYGVGTLTQMGAGFFPLALGTILVLLGILIAAGARRVSAHGILPTVSNGRREGGGIEWRGWFCILASVAAFVVLGQWGGLLPAAFAITFIAALGDRDNNWRSALVLALIITAIAGVIFHWALQVQLPLFGWGL